MKPTLLVLAAGIGSRYGGLKQIEPVGPHGEIVIDYSVHDALRAGFGRIVFVIRRDMESLFREKVARRFSGRIAVDYVYQEIDSLPSGFSPPPNRTKPWGTAHAILMGESAIREPFGVINADDFYGPESFRALGQWLENARETVPASYGMVGFILRNTLSEHGTVSRGVCRCDAAGHLVNIVEHTRVERHGEKILNTDSSGQPHRLTGEEIVSMNMWAFTPSVFEALKSQFEEFLRSYGSDLKREYFIPNVIDRLVKEEKARVAVLKNKGVWFGVTYPGDKAVVAAGIRRLIDQGVYPDPLT